MYNLCDECRTILVLQCTIYVMNVVLYYSYNVQSM